MFMFSVCYPVLPAFPLAPERAFQIIGLQVGRRLNNDLDKFLVHRQIQGLLADVQALLYNFVRISLFLGDL